MVPMYTPRTSCVRRRSNTILLLLDILLFVRIARPVAYRRRSVLSLENTPLHDAAREGHTGTVGILVKNGADVDAKNNVFL